MIGRIIRSNLLKDGIGMQLDILRERRMQMQREIKFRAWIKEEKQLRIVEKLWLPLEPFPMTSVIVDGCRHFGIDETSLMQYTGLKDAKSKEIYEDDIVKLNGINIGIVEYRNDACLFIVADKLKTKCCTFMDVFIEKVEIEVIGNIYENPELLEREVSQ